MHRWRRSMTSATDSYGSHDSSRTRGITGDAKSQVGGRRRCCRNGASVGCPGTTSSSPTVGAVAPRAVVLRSPTTGITVVRDLWRQTHRGLCAAVLRATAVRWLRRAAPVPAVQGANADERRSHRRGAGKGLERLRVRGAAPGRGLCQRRARPRAGRAPRGAALQGRRRRGRRGRPAQSWFDVHERR